jgi:type IV pilus assembly protein PilY1
MIASHRPAFTRICAAALAAALAFQPLAVYAAPIGVTLAEVPIQGLNPVKPNIMFTMDDSGSMGWDYLPDYVAWAGAGITHCRDGLQCGGATSAPGTGYLFSQYDPPVRSSSYNGVFYEPSATYRPGKKADGTDLPCEGVDTTCGAPWTSVYSNGFAGYPGVNSSTTIDLTTSYPDTVWCWKAGPTALEKQTADTNGSVCRRNGRPYSAVTIGGNTTPTITAGYNYPNGSAACAGAEKCKFVNGYTLNGNPYYYNIAKVQFCSGKDAAGWGIAPCVSQWDPATYKYVRYGTGAATFDPQAFTRVDIKPSGFLVNGAAAANPSGRTYAQEMANFAKWYAFYRTRILAMKAAFTRSGKTIRCSQTSRISRPPTSRPG